MTYNTGPKIVTDGLVLCLDAADRNSYPGSGSTWYDLSGNGYHGTLQNSPSFITDNAGNFRFVSAINDYIEINHSSLSSTNSSTVTLEVFFKTTGTGSYAPLLVFSPTSRASTWNTYFTTGNFTGYWSNESLSFYSGVDYLGFAHTNGHAFLQDGSWHQAVVVLAQNNYKLYVDGQNVSLNAAFRNGSQSTTMLTDLFSGGILVGTTADHFNGNISRISIYNKTLSASEILQNYKATKGRFGL